MSDRDKELIKALKEIYENNHPTHAELTLKKIADWLGVKKSSLHSGLFNYGDYITPPKLQKLLDSIRKNSHLK